MATKNDLKGWVVQALTAQGGEAPILLPLQSMSGITMKRSSGHQVSSFTRGNTIYDGRPMSLELKVTFSQNQRAIGSRGGFPILRLASSHRRASPKAYSPIFYGDQG